MITDAHIAALHKAGFLGVTKHADHIVVLDPVVNHSGSTRWLTFTPVALRTGGAVWNFINERS